MTSEELNQFLMDNTLSLVSSNSKQIETMLSQIDFSQDINVISSQLASIIATTSVSLATGLTLRLLDSYGIIDLEKTDIKPNFKVISGGLQNPEHT